MQIKAVPTHLPRAAIDHSVGGEEEDGVVALAAHHPDRRRRGLEMGPHLGVTVGLVQGEKADETTVRDTAKRHRVVALAYNQGERGEEEEGVRQQERAAGKGGNGQMR